MSEDFGWTDFGTATLAPFRRKHRRSNEARFAPIEALRRFWLAWLEGLRSFLVGIVTGSLGSLS